MNKTSKKASPRKGGRPSKEKAGRLRDDILDAASGLFFEQGYGLTSVEAIAAKAGISKRTFYDRFNDKADVFRAVVERVIERLSPFKTASLLDDKDIETSLKKLASVMLRATLTPESLALNRLILAEATRFPELAELMNVQGVRQKAVGLIAELLQREISSGRFSLRDPVFAAEQFMQMTTSLPLRRALMLGQTMTTHEIDKWASDAVGLFLNGCRKG